MLKERPEFCAAIGKCIAIWSYVDNEIGNLFGLLLGTQSDAALHVFLSLRRMSTQRGALQAAARFSLSGDTSTVFDALMTVYQSLEKRRNDLAHGCFGICPDDPSLLFWINIKHHVHFQVETLSKEANGIIEADRHKRLRENLYVYRIEDLTKLYEEMEEFWRSVFHLNGYLRNPNNVGRRVEFEDLRAKLACHRHTVN